MSSTSPTLVIDDSTVHFNISRDDAQQPGPYTLVGDSVDLARKSAWNDSMTIITAASVGFWQNVTGVLSVNYHDSMKFDD